MDDSETNIYIKDKNSGLCINYSSYEPWHKKTVWIKSLYDKNHKIFSSANLVKKYKYTNLVKNGIIRIIGNCQDWVELCYLESCHIKRQKQNKTKQN